MNPPRCLVRRIPPIVAAVLVALVASPPAARSESGFLDPAFGTGGIVTTDFALGNDEAAAVTVVGDRILVAGYEYSPDANFALAAYDSRGRLDRAFGVRGRSITDFLGHDYSFDIAVQGDGKIVVAGLANATGNSDFALARYTSRGALDPSFSGDGKVTTDSGSSYEGFAAVAIQPDGKIVAAGFSHNGSNSDLALARYLANGSLDASFGTRGMVISDVGSSDDWGNDLAIRSDGTIVVAGVTGDDFLLARYLADGTLDRRFGAGGLVITNVGPREYGGTLALLPDGRLLVAGSTDVIPFSSHDSVLFRYRADGTLDTTFAGVGWVTTDFGSTFDYATSVAILPNGKIVVVGAGQSEAGSFDGEVAVYRADGTLDPSFGVGGKLVIDFGSPWDWVLDVAVRADGKFVVVGSTNPSSANSDFLVARFKGTR